jgi:large subunit ribosomal protein L4e
MARGHLIDQVPEIPLVVDNSLEAAAKTTAARAILKAIGALEDVDKVAESRKIRAGKGKMRNRRYVQRRGPLVIYKTNDGVERAFRNLPGVELCCVTRLNLLQLAPGGHMGRFCVWSQAALDELEAIYGEGGKRVPVPAMTNADVARIINSDEVQSVVNPTKPGQKDYPKKANPLRNTDALERLDPYAAAKRRSEAKAAEARASKKAEILAEKRKAKKGKKQHKAQGKAFYEKVSAQGDVCANGFTLS